MTRACSSLNEFEITTIFSLSMHIDHELDSMNSGCRCGVGPGDCSWRTPYDRTYTLLLGEYAERGRIQSLADCDIRVANLQTRDQGLWSCMKGGNQVQVTKTQLKIESKYFLFVIKIRSTRILRQAYYKMLIFMIYA